MPPRILTALLLILTLCPALAEAATSYDVRDAGATGDGTTNDTAALQKTIDTAATAGGGTVTVPAGTYMTGSIELKSRVTLDLAQGAVIHGTSDPADYPIVHARWEGLDHECHQALIFATDADDIAITGSGSVIGEGKVGKLRGPRGPTLFEPTNCNGVHISGVTVSNDGVWTLHPTYCQNVTVSHVTVASVGGNSDGFDPDSCEHVSVDHCSFSAGDDDISIKSGKGQEGVKIGKPSDDITITDCKFIKGHAGVALGSELSGGISNVTVSHCSFDAGVKEALYIKTCPGRAGYVRDFKADHLVVNVPLLTLLTTYHANPDAQGVAGDAGLTDVGGINISNVQANAKELVKVVATPERPLDGLTLSGITGTCERGFIIVNAKNVMLKGIQLNGMKKGVLFIQNVQGTGLDGAIPYTPDVTK